MRGRAPILRTASGFVGTMGGQQTYSGLDPLPTTVEGATTMKVLRP